MHSRRTAVRFVSSFHHNDVARFFWAFVVEGGSIEGNIVDGDGKEGGQGDKVGASDTTLCDHGVDSARCRSG